MQLMVNWYDLVRNVTVIRNATETLPATLPSVEILSHLHSIDGSGINYRRFRWQAMHFVPTQVTLRLVDIIMENPVLKWHYLTMGELNCTVKLVESRRVDQCGIRSRFLLRYYYSINSLNLSIKSIRYMTFFSEFSHFISFKTVIKSNINNTISENIYSILHFVVCCFCFDFIFRFYKQFNFYRLLVLRF